MVRNGDGQTTTQSDDPDRHVIARHLRLTCIPVTHVEYTFDGHELEYTAVGASGSERFWADHSQHDGPVWGASSRRSCAT